MVESMKVHIHSGVARILPRRFFGGGLLARAGLERVRVDPRAEGSRPKRTNRCTMREMEVF